ncbi:XRE family transcriptional regulator [Bombilactobacillus thymidiniphilus]|uniref:XRE family transcriptional regulator n=1 Tax=Bombilactobacillus thymidiniphilus TaxID=2923363 RepID=A0ABY4PE83_9LACO|nr:XRE family transcriptional regulator [Bombilactobacillus thymidiniphilus]UQS84093.1 XRE family transcriptional regulator [Bombilactobacillus thymidiniphilus]
MPDIEKSELKEKILRPKNNLRDARISLGYSTTYMANLIGLRNRRQYEQKEHGNVPFHDYEMLIISQKFLKPINYLFIEDLNVPDDLM